MNTRAPPPLLPGPRHHRRRRPLDGPLDHLRLPTAAAFPTTTVTDRLHSVITTAFAATPAAALRPCRYSIDCQWIDITGLPNGQYWLTVATNWNEQTRAQTSPENNYTNNEANVPIEITGMGVTILTSTQVGQACGWSG